MLAPVGRARDRRAAVTADAFGAHCVRKLSHGVHSTGWAHSFALPDAIEKVMDATYSMRRERRPLMMASFIRRRPGSSIQTAHGSAPRAIADAVLASADLIRRGH